MIHLDRDDDVQDHEPSPAPAVEPDRTAGKSHLLESSKVLRFLKTERLVHWSIAVPFVVCFTTAVILIVFYNNDPQRSYRAIFSWMHRISGLALAVLPPLVLYRTRSDYRIHLQNIRQAWVWSLDDVRWLMRSGRAALDPKVDLPEQGKFNAAEKLNFMMVMSTYPLFIVTGLLIWMPGVAFVSWLVHFSLAVIAAPLVLGHVFMATVNPSTRIGLEGMITGFVDREWAKHHYRKWYRQYFERPARPVWARRAARAPGTGVVEGAPRPVNGTRAATPPHALPVTPPATGPVIQGDAPAAAAAGGSGHAPLPQAGALDRATAVDQPGRTSGVPVVVPAAGAAEPARRRRITPSDLKRTARVRCRDCRTVLTFPSWELLLQKTFEVRAVLLCPHCRSEISAIRTLTAPKVAETILFHLEANGADHPLDGQAFPAA